MKQLTISIASFENQFADFSLIGGVLEWADSGRGESGMWGSIECPCFHHNWKKSGERIRLFAQQGPLLK